MQQEKRYRYKKKISFEFIIVHLEQVIVDGTIIKQTKVGGI